MMENVIMKAIYTTGFFLRFHQNSPVANKLFEENPKYRDKEVIVVQLMTIDGGYMIAEVVHKKDSNG